MVQNNGKTTERTVEYYRRFRPNSFKAVVGQPEAVEQLEAWVNKRDLPHVLLLHGHTGSGKTTAARIVAAKMGCNLDLDLLELNCADDRGINTIREIDEAVGYKAMGGTCRFWILDECQQLTSQGQKALLKVLENGPLHCYFVLCTTEPYKLIDTLRGRCQQIQFSRVGREPMLTALARITKLSGVTLSQKVLDHIVEAADGSVRVAVQMYEQASQLAEEEAQLNAIRREDDVQFGEDLAKALMDRSRTWKDIAKMLREFKGEPENARRIILGYAAGVLRNGKDDKHAYLILCSFECNYYDSGRSGLLKSCYEVFCQRPK